MDDNYAQASEQASPTQRVANAQNSLAAKWSKQDANWCHNFNFWQLGLAETDSDNHRSFLGPGAISCPTRILAADCLYDTENVDPFAQTLEELSGIGSEALVAFDTSLASTGSSRRQSWAPA